MCFYTCLYANEDIMSDKTLFSLCNSVFNEYDSEKSFEETIQDDKKSADFIRKCLKDDTYQEPKDGTDLYFVAQTRARHSLITFLMGKVFAEFSDLYVKANKSVPCKDDDDLWLLTSLNHDRGYYSKYITQKEFDFEKTFIYYYLLKDFAFLKNNSAIAAYTKKEIEGYASYKSCEYHEKNPDCKERVDHGILGGCITYDELMRKLIKSGEDEENKLMIISCCLVIAQHNIFKSQDEETDKVYEKNGLSRLKSESEFRISLHTPLLLLLCLVDTIECVKKFSKGENEKSLETKTVLNSIEVSVDKNHIVIDFSKLYKKIKEKNNNELSVKFDNYINSVLNLHSWTKFDAKKQNEYCVQIGISES